MRAENRRIDTKPHKWSGEETLRNTKRYEQREIRQNASGVLPKQVLYQAEPRPDRLDRGVMTEPPTAA